MIRMLSPRPPATSPRIASLAAIAWVSALWSCGGAPLPHETPAHAAASASRSASPPAPPSSLGFSSVATAPEGTLGPYVAYGVKGAMAMFSPGGESPRRWIAQPLGPDGSPTSSPGNLADAPDDVSFAVLRANDPIDRFLGLWSGEGVANGALFGGLMRADGTPVCKTVELARGQPILWAEAIAVKDGFIVLWAEQDGGHARILARKLLSSGALAGDPAVIESAALAWQTQALPTGAALVATRAVAGTSSLGTVALRLIDADAQPSVAPVVLTDRPTAQLDVDIARVRDSLLIAWTDRRDIDSRVWVAVTDLRGSVIEPARGALEPSGDQALLDIVSPTDPAVDRAMVVIDTLPHSRPDTLDAAVAMLDEQGKVVGNSARLTLAADAVSETHFAGAPGGFLVLARAPDCLTTDRSRALVPWYLRVSGDQTVVSASPLRWGGDRDVVSLAWAPGCIGNRCFAVGADASRPATVMTLRLDHRPPRCTTPWTKPDQASSALHSNRALVSVDGPLSTLSATSVGSSSLVGWITHFVESPAGTTKRPPPDAPGDPSKPVAAEVGLQLVDDHGAPVGPRRLISVRGYSPGGIAIASDPASKDACVAWVARDNGIPQVFVTKVGPDGARKAQRMLTRARGDAADVAIARVTGGWVVAWVDGRDGNGEVYAARIDDQLRPIGPEVRVTQAPGDASGISLLALDDEILVGFGDTRARPDRGMAVPYYRRLKLANLAPIGEDRPIALTRLHAQSVRLVRVAQGVVATWLEVAVPGVPHDPQDRPGARVVRFDPSSGQTLAAPTVVTPEAGEPTSYDLQCGDAACFGVMSVDAGGSAQLVSFEWKPTGQASALTIVATLGGPPGADVCPTILGDALLYGDSSPSGERRIRRATVNTGAR